MKKIISILIISILLVGCGKEQSLESVVRSALARPLPVTTNHKKTYLKYYLPPSVGLLKTNENSSLILIDGNQVLMNLNIDSIVADTFNYNDTTKSTLEKDFEYQHSGTYYNRNNEEISFNIWVLKLNDGDFALYIDNREVQLISVVPKAQVSITLENMITILRSVEVDASKVVAAYSNKILKKDLIIYSEFFEQVPPETGTLEEMYKQLEPGKD